MPSKRNPKPRIVTEATKAKLPRPRKPKDTRRPACHSNYVETPSPIAGQALPEVGTMPAPDFRVVPIPCMDWPADSPPSGNWQASVRPRMDWDLLYVPPDTAPYPWPLRVLDWVDERIVAARTRVAAWLRALSRKVAP